MSTTYTGIDYGHGRSNIDNETGIRFGVISQHSISPDAFDDVWQNARDLSYENAVAEFKAQMERCENDDELNEFICDQFGASASARIGFLRREEGMESVWSDVEQEFNDAYMDNGEHDWLYESDGYKLTNCLSTDVMVLASPYFTYAQFCSPCVPGACNLDSPLEHAATVKPVYGEHDLSQNNRAYCLGHDYFEGGRAPYPVYSVATGELIAPAE